MNRLNIFHKIITKRKYSILYGMVALIMPFVCILSLAPIIKDGLNITPITIAFIATYFAIFICLKYNKEIDNKTTKENTSNE